YLYIYEPDGRGIITHLHVYDRTDKLNIEENDVEIVWSLDGNRCGVVIWGGMRGIIDMSKNKEWRIWLEDRNTPAISDPEWLRGFSLHHSIFSSRSRNPRSAPQSCQFIRLIQSMCKEAHQNNVTYFYEVTRSWRSLTDLSETGASKIRQRILAGLLTSLLPQ